MGGRQKFFKPLRNVTIWHVEVDGKKTLNWIYIGREYVHRSTDSAYV